MYLRRLNMISKIRDEEEFVIFFKRVIVRRVINVDFII